MLKNFLMRKLLESQLKQIPQEQRDQIISVVEKNPELFTNIAKEVQEKVKAGKDQQTASMEVMMKYKDELAKAMKE
mgnify:CR=1 FL=1